MAESRSPNHARPASDGAVVVACRNTDATNALLRGAARMEPRDLFARETWDLEEQTTTH